MPKEKCKLTRAEIWTYNGHFGGVGMARANMRNIAESNHTTDASKAIAQRILADLALLSFELKTRKDQLDG